LNRHRLCKGKKNAILHNLIYVWLLILKRINTLINEFQRDPFEGIGKPEPLKHSLSGYWSRRINDEHRIVYKVTDDNVLIAQLRYHY